MRGRRLLVLVAVPALGVGPVAAVAVDGTGVAFADDRPLTITTPLPGAGVPVTVCNSSALPATVTVGDFTKDDKPVADAVLTVAPASVPSGCHPVVLKEAANVADGSYSGVLVAVAPGAGVARRPVAFAKNMPAAGHVTGALKSFDLAGQFGACTPMGGALRLYDDELVVSTKGTLARLEPGTVLGRVANGDDVAAVEVSGEVKKLSDDTVKIPVKVTGVDRRGTFKGTLTKLTDKDGNPHAITVTVAHHWWLLVLTVILGLAAGALAKVLAARWLPGWWLRLRQSRLYGRYETVASPVCRGYVKPSREKITTFVEGNQAAYRAYLDATSVVDPTNAAYKAVRESLAAAEKDADLLRGDDDSAFCAALTTLEKTLQTFKGDFGKVFPGGTPIPRFVIEAQGLIAPGAAKRRLDVGQATKLKAKADEANATLELGSRLSLAYQSLRDRLRGIQGADAEALAKVNACLQRAEAALLDVGGTGRLDGDEVVKALREAYALHPSVASTDPSLIVGSITDRSRTRWITRRAALAAEASAMPSALQSASIGFPGEMGDPTIEAVMGGIGILGELFVGLVAGGTALLIATAALYEGKPFGSVADYLTAFGAAAGAQALASSVVTSLANWRSATPA